MSTYVDFGQTPGLSRQASAVCSMAAAAIAAAKPASSQQQLDVHPLKYGMFMYFHVFL